MKKYSLFIPLTLLLAGCDTTPVPLSVALPTLENDLSSQGTVSITDYDSVVTANSLKFDRGIRAAQCGQNNPNPIIAFLPSAFTLTLSGGYTDSAGLSVANPSPTGLTFGLSLTKGQQVAAPVQFTALLNLANYDLQQNLSFVSSVSDTLVKGNRSDVSTEQSRTWIAAWKIAATRKFLERRDSLDSHIRQLVDSYTANNAECPAQPGPPVIPK